MYVIGAHFGHDASLAIVGSGRIIHYEKERFTRQRHDIGDVKFLYDLAIKEENINPDEIIAVVGTSTSDMFNGGTRRPYWSDLTEVDRGSTNYFGTSLPCYWIPHHIAHVAYAFYASPFEEADVLAIDGIGDNYCNRKVDHAVGHIIHHFGSAENVWLVEHPEFIAIGRKWDEMATELYGNWWSAGTVMALVGIPKENFCALTGFDISVRDRVGDLQNWTTESFCSFFSGHYPAVLSGGCALNGIANNAVLKKCKRMRVPPSANDGGTSVGAALYLLHHVLGQPRVRYSPETIAYGGIVGDFPCLDIGKVADEILAGKIVPFAYGGAESGPRALGHRSFLADPRSMASRDRLNRVKGRQRYRPTAPVVLLEFANEYFDIVDPGAYDYMTVIAQAKQKAKDEFPAALHYDGSARVQIALEGQCIGELLKELYRREKLPMLLNTSLNLKGQPIVNSQADMNSIEKALGECGS